MTKETKDLGAAPPRTLTDSEMVAIETYYGPEGLADGEDPGVIAAIVELRSAREAIRFALSPESGFACPASTEERLRSALGHGPGTAPQAPSGSSAALLEARRLLEEVRREFLWGGTVKGREFADRLDAFLRSDSERSEHGKG